MIHKHFSLVVLYSVARWDVDHEGASKSDATLDGERISQRNVEGRIGQHYQVSRNCGWSTDEEGAAWGQSNVANNLPDSAHATCSGGACSSARGRGGGTARR